MKTRLVRVLLLCLFTALLAIPFLDRAQFLQVVLFYVTMKPVSGWQLIAPGDAAIFASITALVYLSFVPRIPFFLTLLSRLSAVVLYLIYLVDLYILRNFYTRLLLEDAAKYLSYSGKYLVQQYHGKLWLLPVPAVLLIVLGYFLVERRRIRSRVTHGYFVLLFSMLLSVSLFASQHQYVHAWTYQNIFRYNYSVYSSAKPYSEEFARHHLYVEDVVTQPKKALTPNVILLMVESLSAYHSALFSGINDWTPELDAIARQNFYYEDFYANGFMTEDAEISLLTGLLPIYPPSNNSFVGVEAFTGFHNVAESLPRLLHDKGYVSDFMTTADLAFSGTGEWAKGIGFDYVEGHEHPYYNGFKRFQFHSAPDAALYDRVMSRIAEHHERYFIFLKTVSTHHPFEDPEGGPPSEQTVVRYADRQIGAFYRRLTEAGFFKNGILIIVGDHHAMVPLSAAELEKFGEHRAAARVPAVVCRGNDARGIEKRAFQQVDIYNGIKNLVSDQMSSSKWRGDALNEPRPAATYIAHRRGDDRGMVSVFSPDQDYQLHLDGDATALTGGGVDAADEHALLDKINAVRIDRVHSFAKTTVE